MGGERVPVAKLASLELAPASRGAGPFHRKGHIGPFGLAVLAAAALLPFVLVFCRSLALPGGESAWVPGVGMLRDLGTVLDRSFTLDWIPPNDRSSILYLLLLPTGALIVAFTRLTLGVRVLGFRAILIAMGFRASGVLPSLGLMLFVIGTIVLIRPWFRKIRLPLYARIAVILCLSATTMIGALLIAPWLRSEAIWSVAFFPVIIMAMLAEGVAKTLEEDDALAATWRAGWTVLLALVVALVDRLIAPLIYDFPELMLTEVIAIVFIAEFLDLRLLEEWPARLSRWVAGTRPWFPAKPRIAVVRNQGSGGFVGRLGAPAPARYRKRSVQRPVDALRAQGFEVKVLEGDMTLLKELASYLTPDPRRGTPGGIVFNLATGVQGEGRLSHVPAMLEMAGLAYTGPGPVAHARLSDRLTLLTVLEQASLAVPACRTVDDPSLPLDLDFPLTARPRFEPDAGRIVVRNRRKLQAAVREIRRVYGQPTVVEQIVRGRRIHASLLGNGTVECLPLLEVPPGEEAKVCPAPLEEAEIERIRSCALRAFAAAGCRDYARIDIRFSSLGGEPVVVDVRSADLLERRGAFLTSAHAAGYTLPALLRRIVDEAAQRYLASATAAAEPEATGEESKIVSLAERRAAAE
jgi:D-alanine-D-alanine ligase